MYKNNKISKNMKFFKFINLLTFYNLIFNLNNFYGLIVKQKNLFKKIKILYIQKLLIGFSQKMKLYSQSFTKSKTS